MTNCNVHQLVPTHLDNIFFDDDDDACRVLSPLAGAILLPALITNFGLRLKNRPTLASVFRSQYNRNTQGGFSQSENMGLRKSRNLVRAANCGVCVDLLQIIIDSGSPCFTDNLPPSYLLLLLAIKAQLFLIGNLSKTDVNSAPPPIYGYEPTASVGVRFKVFCQNYEHLRREWGGQGACTEFGRGVGALWRATSLPPVRPPDLSVTVWVRKKRWKDRLERRSRLASSVG